jgi:septum formation protein
LSPFSLLLASQSPRRRQLLESIGLSFKILDIDVEELPTKTKIKAALFVCKNAEKKALAGLEKAKETEIVIGADTIVTIKNQILGKPKDLEEAYRFLSLLSGKTHKVFTGISLASKSLGTRKNFDCSEVTFKKLSKSEISAYLSTKEPYDKAGAYAIQGLGSILIKNIKGSYTNIMGFPIELFLSELEKLSKIKIYKWFR